MATEAPEAQEAQGLKAGSPQWSQRNAGKCHVWGASTLLGRFLQHFKILTWRLQDMNDSNDPELLKLFGKLATIFCVFICQISMKIQEGFIRIVGSFKIFLRGLMTDNSSHSTL